MSDREERILVGVPTYPGHAFCRERFVEALNEISVPDNVDVYIVWNGDSEPYGFGDFLLSKYKPLKKLNGNQILCAKQNMIRRKVLNGDYTHLLMLESDHVPPHDVISTLLSHRKDIVSGLYFIRGRQDIILNLNTMPIVKQQLIDTGKYETDIVWLIRESALPSIWGIKRTGLSGIHQPHAYMQLWDLEDWIDTRLQGKRLEQALACGMGCILISRDVLEKVKYEDEIGYSKRIGHEAQQLTDYIYCDAVHRAGFEIYVDLECIVQHLHTDVQEIQANKKWFNVEPMKGLPTKHTTFPINLKKKEQIAAP